MVTQELDGPLARYIGEYPERVVFRCMQAVLWCETGRREESRDLLDELGCDGFADLPSRQEWFFGTGLLAEARNPHSLAFQVRRLLHDAELGERLAEAGRLKVEDEFNIRKNAARLADLFPAA